MKLVQVSNANFDALLELSLQLWPENDWNELRSIYEKNLGSASHHHMLAVDDNGMAIGFINLSLRFDYVEGCSTSPVGYIEGIYVIPEFRKHGVARMMIDYGQEWARSKGCKEFASDTPLENLQSQKFHQAIGFDQQSTIVHFWKRI